MDSKAVWDYPPRVSEESHQVPRLIETWQLQCETKLIMCIISSALGLAIDHTCFNYLYLVGDHGIEKVAGLRVLQTFWTTRRPGGVHDKKRVIAFHWLRITALINFLHFLGTQREANITLTGQLKHATSKYSATKQRGNSFSDFFSDCAYTTRINQTDYKLQQVSKNPMIYATSFFFFPWKRQWEDFLYSLSVLYNFKYANVMLTHSIPLSVYHLCISGGYSISRVRYSFNQDWAGQIIKVMHTFSIKRWEIKVSKV